MTEGFFEGGCEADSKEKLDFVSQLLYQYQRCREEISDWSRKHSIDAPQHAVHVLLVMIQEPSILNLAGMKKDDLAKMIEEAYEEPDKLLKPIRVEGEQAKILALFMICQNVLGRARLLDLNKTIISRG